MIKISIFLPENFHFSVVKFLLYLKRHVFVLAELWFEPPTPGSWSAVRRGTDCAMEPALQHKTQPNLWMMTCISYSNGRPRWLSWLRVRLETRRSRVRPPSRSATFFRGDWSWNIFYGHSHPSTDSRRAVVSFWRKNVHNTGNSFRGLSLPSKRVLR